MDFAYYKEMMKQCSELTTAALEKKCNFYQHILLVSVTVFAIVISLHSGASGGTYLSYIFASSTILLAIGVLSMAIVYKGYVWLADEAKKKFSKALSKAYREGSTVGDIYGSTSKTTTFFEYLGAIALILSSIGFTAHTVICALI